MRNILAQFASLRSLVSARSRGSEGRRSIGAVVAGTVLGQGLGVLCAPLVTRLYDPADLGALAVYVSLLSMVAVTASLRYELAINVSRDDEEAANVLSLALLLALATATFAAVAVSLGGKAIAESIGVVRLAPHLWMLPLSILGVGCYQALNYWAVHRAQFTRIARTKVTQGTTQAVGQISLGALGVAPAGLFAADVFARFSGVGTLARLAWQSDRPLLKRISFRGMLAAAKRHRRFPLISSWSAILNTLGLQAPVLLLSADYGTQVTGNFSLVQRVMAAPLALVGQAVGMYYIGQGAKLWRVDSSKFRALFNRTAQRLALFGGLPLLGIGLLSPKVFPVIFGAEWTEAGVFSRSLGFMFAAQLIVVPISQTLNLLGRQDLQLGWDVARLCLVVAVLRFASQSGQGAEVAIALYSGAMLLAYAALLFLSAWQLRNCDKAPPTAGPA